MIINWQRSVVSQNDIEDLCLDLFTGEEWSYLVETCLLLLCRIVLTHALFSKFSYFSSCCVSLTGYTRCEKQKVIGKIDASAEGCTTAGHMFVENQLKCYLLYLVSENFFV